MSSTLIETAATVEASPDRVYELIADYRSGHPRILPPSVFSELVVEDGGRGAGTRLRFDMRAFGTRRRFHVEVDEPEPGRVLVERELGTGSVTVFHLEPVGAGATRVTIATRLPRKDGRLGRLQGWLSASFLRRVYRDELRLLAGALGRETGRSQGANPVAAGTCGASDGKVGFQGESVRH